MTGLTRAGASLTAAQKKRIRRLLKDARKNSRHSQIDLQSYLLMPIQRIPRYKLLLASLAECTPAEGEDSIPDPLVSAALESMSQLASEMNERKRDSEGRKRLVRRFAGPAALCQHRSQIYWQGRLGKIFKSPIVQAHRTVLKEGSMTLTRVVKRNSNLIASAKPSVEEETSLVWVHSLAVKSERRDLVSEPPSDTDDSTNLFFDSFS